MSELSRTTKMVVAHFPSGEGNPYNKLLSQALETDDIKVASIPNKFHKNPWRTLRFASDYQLVHFHWFNGHYDGKSVVRFFIRSLLFLGSLALLKLKGTRMVQTVHNLVPHEHSYRGLHRMVNVGLGRLMDCLIVHNPASIDRVSREFCARDKVILVEHIDYGPWIAKTRAQLKSSAKKSVRRENARKRIVFFGQLRPYKGIETLLDAAVLCDHEFSIIGKPFTKEYGQFLEAKVSLLPNVSILSRFVEDGELSTILIDSDVAVFPYGDTLCSGAAHYALAHGLPTVAKSTTAFEEFINLDLAIEWREPYTSEELVNSIEEACTIEKSSWLQASKAYRTRCSALSVGSKLSALYSKILGIES